MPDNPTGKPANEPTPDALPDGDIDSALSELSSLADSLADEVGPSDAQETQSAEDAVSPSSHSADADAIDAKLDQIEQSLAETRSQVTGTDSANVLEVEQPAGEEPAVEEPFVDEAMDYRAAAAALGDTLSVSTEPEPGADEPPQSADAGPAPEPPASPHKKQTGGKVVQLGKREAKPPAEAKDGVETSPGYDLADENLADAPGNENLPSLDDTGDAADSVEAPSQRGDGLPSARAKVRAPSAPGRGSVLPEPAVSALGAVLDVMDLPFRRAGDRIRQVIGWLALAILFAAIVVFALSFLQ